MKKNITLRQLEIFVNVGIYKSVSYASENKLFISQSAASMAIKELEKQLGIELFNRYKNKLTLNSDGEIFFNYANEILDRINDIDNVINKNPKNISGIIKIGASTTIGNYVLPKLIGHFNKIYPNLKIILLIDNTEKIINMLSEFKIDIGYIEGICNEKNIEVKSWKDDELVIFANYKNSILKPSPKNIEDILKTDWILRERGSGTRTIFENALSDKLKKINVKFEFGNTESIKNAVLNNMGISCLSKLTIKREIQSKTFKIINIPNLNLSRKFYRIIHKKKYLTKKLILLLDDKFKFN